VWQQQQQHSYYADGTIGGFHALRHVVAMSDSAIFGTPTETETATENSVYANLQQLYPASGAYEGEGDALLPFGSTRFYLFGPADASERVSKISSSCVASRSFIQTHDSCLCHFDIQMTCTDGVCARNWSSVHCV
jgi:hypothetical protein